ncbi:MAG TPA: pitrilysin family protein [Bryobacteraceae bacterium]|nr:pitrilysin family protein [Bryobacteraceae bacterium]
MNLAIHVSQDGILRAGYHGTVVARFPSRARQQAVRTLQRHQTSRVVAKLLVTSLLLSCAAAAQPAPKTTPSYKALRFPPLREVSIPQLAESTLPNGMRLYLLENHELPLVSGFALVRTGNLFEPPDKVGLAGMTGSVMRTGGTKSRTGDQLDVELENIAAGVESGIGETSGSVSFTCLRENVDQVLAIFKDVLTSPEFRQDKIDLVRNELRGAIARRNDDPENIVSREFASTIYGRDNPYGWSLEYEHVDRIQREDLIAFYKRYFFPAHIMLAIQGDFSAPEMRARIETLFAGWTVTQPPVPPFPPVKAKPAPGIWLATRNEVTQTFFRLGHLGGTRRDPDYPALSVMSEILGGSFASRLFTEVRTRQGLVYNVAGGWGANFNHPGLFAIAGSTKSASTVDAIQAVRKEIERIRTSPVSEQELEYAKGAVLNSFVFLFDHPSKTLNRILTYEYFGYPRDFIFQYQKAVRAVTKEDILRVAKQHLNPAILTTVAAGKPSEFGKPLATVGEVHNIDLTIPEPKSAQQAASSAQADSAADAKARALLERAREQLGPAPRDIVMTADSAIQSPQGTMMSGKSQLWIIMPGELRSEQQLPFGKVTVYYDRKGGGWISGPQGDMPLPAPVLAQVRQQLFRTLHNLVAATGNFRSAGDNAVELSGPDGFTTRVEFDANGLPVSQTYRGLSMAGPPATVVERYSEWKQSGGVRYPAKIVLEQNGNKAAEMTVTDYRVNTGLKSEDLSRKP